MQLVPCLNTWSFFRIIFDLISRPSSQLQHRSDLRSSQETCTGDIKCQETCHRFCLSPVCVAYRRAGGCSQPHGRAARQCSAGQEASSPFSPGRLKSGRPPCARGYCAMYSRVVYYETLPLFPQLCKVQASIYSDI